MKKYLLVFVFLCLTVCICLYFILATQHSKGVPANAVAYNIADTQQLGKEAAFVQTLDISGQIVYFKKLTDDAGALYAYELLRRVQLGDTDKHLLGHVIGNDLFDQEGLNGLSICTPEFTFACYHSVIGRAVEEQGLDNMDVINQKCLQLKNKGLCEHGLGHGVMAAMGYKDPVGAFSICDSLAKENGLPRPCMEGALMEFNFRMQEVPISKYRPLDEKGYYYPCDEMPAKETNECFYEQTLWWRQLLGITNFSAIGALCDGLANEGNRDWCYRGVGRLIPEYSHESADVMARECFEATKDKGGQAYCLQMLRDTIKNDGSICDLLDTGHRDTCRLPVPELEVD